MIVCCGEALIDMLPRTLPDGSDCFLPVPGGAVFNTAIALGRLGIESGLISGISRDMFGGQLVDALAASNVDTRFAIRSDRPTTLAFVKLVDGTATYSFYDENTAMRMVQTQQFPDLAGIATALHFGGISLIAEPSGTAYEHLLSQSRQSMLISIDPNIRPNFIADEGAYRARLDRMIGQSDIVKVSDEDLTWLYPGRTFEEAADLWIADGSALVVQTMGFKGARARHPNFDIAIPAPEIEIVDTVGAGDAFNAGLLARLRRSDRLSKSAIRQLTEADCTVALEYASAVAAYTVGQAGANSPWEHEIR